MNDDLTDSVGLIERRTKMKKFLKFVVGVAGAAAAGRRRTSGIPDYRAERTGS